jgi:hypothetical protein
MALAETGAISNARPTRKKKNYGRKMNGIDKLIFDNL